jgi:5S rRNA maturation endonuclease (ribonuclease M5)
VAEPTRKRADDWQFDAAYDYVDEYGTLLFQVCRTGHGKEKQIRQRQPVDPRDLSKGWWADLDGVDRVLYRLPEVRRAAREAGTVFVVEGEKDVERMRKERRVATCNPGGSAGWKQPFAEALCGAHVIVVRDRDEPGYKWADAVYRSVDGLAESVRIVEARTGNDVYDHLEAGHAVGKFVDVPAPRVTETRARLLTREEFETARSPDTIVERLIYEGSSHVLNGASKTGKSLLATQLAMCVAAGEPFLGLDTEQRPVLLVSLEMSAGLVRDRLSSIARDAELPAVVLGKFFNIVAPTPGKTPQIDLSKPDDVENLRALIEQSRAKLVILDTLYRFIPGADFNDNTAMGEVLGTINSLANDTGAAILVIHHTSKGEQNGSVSQSGLGAQIIGGAANVIARLRRTGGGQEHSWSLEVESHYEPWDEQLSYERPTREDGSRGMGCVRCTASEAHGVNFETLDDLFRKHGQKNGALRFKSQRDFIKAIKDEGLRENDGAARTLIGAIEQDFYSEAGPLTISEGPNRAKIYTWQSDTAAVTTVSGAAL